MYVCDANGVIVDAAARLFALMSQPVNARLLGPLLVDEILIRLLRSRVGARVAQIGSADSRLQRIAKAVTEIRGKFSQPLRMQAPARLNDHGRGVWYERSHRTRRQRAVWTPHRLPIVQNQSLQWRILHRKVASDSESALRLFALSTGDGWGASVMKL